MSTFPSKIFFVLVAKFLHRLLFALNILIAFLLLSAYACMYVSPLSFYLLAFSGLAFPVLFILNLLFLVYYTAQFSIQSLVPALALVSCLPLINTTLELNPFQDRISEKEARSRGMFKCMSYNVRLFDLYNWTNNKSTRDRMISFIRKEAPDILALQEFYADDKNDFINVDTLKKNLNLPFRALHYTITLRKTDHWGMAIFSRYPVINEGSISFSTKSNNACMYADLLIKGDTLRVYNIHLQSIHFKKEDYDFLDSLKSERKTQVEGVKNSKRIFSKLKKAFVKRAGQVELVYKHMQTCPYPMLLAGDFNDSPISYTYTRLSKNMEDAFEGNGVGIGQTYHGSALSLRIDYILHSKNLRSECFVIKKMPFSDHYPLSCFFAFNGKEKK